MQNAEFRKAIQAERVLIFFNYCSILILNSPFSSFPAYEGRIDTDDVRIRVEQLLGGALQSLGTPGSPDEGKRMVAVATGNAYPVDERKAGGYGARPPHDCLHHNSRNNHGYTLSSFTAQILYSGSFETGSTASMVRRLHMWSWSCM